MPFMVGERSSNAVMRVLGDGSMIEMLKRVALGVIGSLGLVAALVNKRGRVRPDALKLLKHLATHTSSSVPELSSRMKLSTDEAARLLADLEMRGFVQISGDHGSGHVRIAAITKAGRQHIAKSATG